MIDPTKTTPEKLVEMNDSLIVDNNYLRGQLKELTRQRDEAFEHIKRIRADQESRDWQMMGISIREAADWSNAAIKESKP